MDTEDIDLHWYKKIWSLDIQDMSWVEQTEHEVDFVVEALELQGHERVLDLACGFGRHALELARRGHPVIGVDFTPAFIKEARRLAAEAKLEQAEFIRADLRAVSFFAEFDVVLNMADGAIGYLESEGMNLKIFDLIASALRPGGKHLMGVCSGDFARKHFPRRHWQIGQQALSLADFEWDAENARMLYRGYTLRYGEPLQKLQEPQKKALSGYTRLYSRDELAKIFTLRGMEIWKSFGDYDTAIPASDDRFLAVICSLKR